MESLGKSRQVVEEGNSVSSSTKKQASRKTFYCFTLFNYENNYDEIIRQLKSYSKKGIVGKEVCPESKNNHLQGFIALKKPMRHTEIKISGQPRWFACNGNEEQNIKYCSKENNYIKWGFPKPINIISNLYSWQKEIELIFETEPNDRTIHWFYDKNGGIGKSAFVKYMVIKHQCLFCDGGKKADLINLVFNNDMDDCKCVIWDLPRNTGNCISYSTIESVKNGMVCNTKYETGVKCFNSPHIFVFANEAPELEKLSQDRWCVKCLD